MKALAEFQARLARESEGAYAASRFADLSRDVFARYCRDPAAAAGDGEVTIDSGWSIALAGSATALARRMADHFADFLRRRMSVDLSPPSGAEPKIHLSESDGGDAIPGSFTLSVTP